MRTVRALAGLAVLALATVPLVARTGRGAEPGPTAVVETRQTVQDDTLALNRLLASVRGAQPFFCELAARSVDGRSWWGNSGSGSGGALEVDSASNALLRWIHGEHADPRVVGRLTAALRDPDGCVRRVAGSMLGHVHHPSARTALVTALNDPNADTRRVAAIGIGIAEDTGAVQPLIRALRDQSPGVRLAAAWALGEVEDRSAMLPLIEALEKDADARVRRAAATSLGRVLDH